MSIEIKLDGETYNCEVIRYVQKSNEFDVLTGTGDSIYVNLNYADFLDYLSWYFANGLGNLVTLRTTYRWSGTREVPKNFYDKVINFISDCNAKSTIMIDGRELPSSISTSTNYLGNDINFLGTQVHEQDGAFLYWGIEEHKFGGELFDEIVARRLKNTGILPIGGVARRGGKYYKYFYNGSVSDMRQAKELFVSNIKKYNNGSNRHSGPSILFKYFFEGGMDWCCAELMYGNLEFIVSALRGASLANNKTDYGGHFAVQWSTTPHDNIYRYRRYFQALMLGYMNGLTQINTEEGCYRLENGAADFERDSSACRAHAGVQNNFYNFVSTHNRRGKLATKIAFIHGKYDGFNGFIDDKVWMVEGEEFKMSSPEKSWELLKLFYPDASLSATYHNDCEAKPLGFHTKTPYGLVDIIPNYSSEELLKNYRYIIFSGWNTCDDELAEKLLKYVQGGGTVLMTLAHLSATVLRCEGINGSGEILSAASALLGDKNNLKRLNTGYCNEIGEGKVLWFDSPLYPAASEIFPEYKMLVNSFAMENMELERSAGAVWTDEWVSTAAYDSSDRRTIYLLNVKWFDDDADIQRAVFHFGAASHLVNVQRDSITIISIFNDIAIITYDMSSDILSCEHGTLKIQGEGRTQITVIKRGENPNYMAMDIDGYAEIAL